MAMRNFRQLCLAAVVLLAAGSLSQAADPVPVDPLARARGRELFNRVWEPNDPRSQAGDGLGPVFNDTSCAACHSQAGLGGGGSIEHNVRVVSISNTTTLKKKQLIHPGFKAQSSLVLHRDHKSIERHAYDGWRKRDCSTGPAKAARTTSRRCRTSFASLR